MTYVAGVDGCRGGWVVAVQDLATATSSVKIVKAFADVLALPESPVVIAVDMPIGLLDVAVRGGRDCEKLARPLLGRPRRSSVFPSPVRAAIQFTQFTSACRANQRSSTAGIGVTKQAFALFDKLREVDAAMTSREQQRVFEVHPELCFYEMAGRKPAQHRKKAPQGRVEREGLLARAGFKVTWARMPGCGVDDVLDALAACWTAGRIHAARAIRLPSPAPVDQRGLRMEIWR